ncbi:MAG TPA: carboxypeptidase regulatory-like domain-containing protein [Kofleriaceae bacterium]
MRAALHGHVIFPNGKGVPGAEVVIQSGPSPLPGWAADETQRDGARKTIAGAEGAFAFDNLRVGTYVVAAVHDDDVAPSTTVSVLPSVSDVTLVMFPGAALEVTVRSETDRAPLAGAMVRVTDGDRSFGEQWSFRTAQTDARGIAKFRGVIATASHVIAASAPGYAETTLAVHDHQFADRSWSVEMVLRKAAQVSGRVVDSDGHGIPNATVSWELDGVARPSDTPDLFDPFPFHGHIQAVQSDAEGRFAISAEPGSGCVLAAHPTHELGEVCDLKISVGSERSGVEVVLKDGGHISGQVVWSDGTPAAGATVIATKRGWIHQPIQSKSYRFEVRTGLDGQFDLRGIKRGELDLTAFTDDASSPLVPIDLTKKSEYRDVKIQLSNEGTIRGRVVDDAKNPVAYAVVKYAIDPNMAPPDAQGKPRERRRADATAQHPDFALPRSIGATRTDRDGNFELRGLPDGMYNVMASRPDAVDMPTAYTMTNELAVAVGDTIELVLKGIGGVKGHVVAETGKPVVTFGISLAPLTAKPRRDQFNVAHQFVSPDGSFSLAAVPAGQYRLRVDGEDVSEQVAADAVTVVSGKTADVGTIKVMRGVRRHGVVLTKQRKPSPAARVTVMLDDKAEPFTLESDDDGAFVIPPLPVEQPLRVRADKYTSTSDWIVIPGGTTKLELVLAKEGLGTISGVLVEGGVPLDKRSIVLTLVGAGTPDDKLSPVRNVLTKEGGAFKIESLPAGDYLIWVKRISRSKQTEGDIWWKQEAPVHVEAQKDTQVVLPVPPRSDGSASDLPGSDQQGGSGQGREGATK